MTDNFRYVVEWLFDPSYRATSYRNYSWGENSRHCDLVKYLEIPVNKEVFDIPVFTFTKFKNRCCEDTMLADAFVVKLKTMDDTSRYKSINRVMQDLLVEKYDENLIKVETVLNDETLVYYATQGAVFDDRFRPMMMLAWKIQRQLINGKDRFKLLKPCMWISYRMYVRRTDPMEKLVCNTVLPYLISQPAARPAQEWLGDAFLPYDTSVMYPKLIVDDFPLVIKDIEYPSISTTNEKLLDIVYEHADEIIQ